MQELLALIEKLGIPAGITIVVLWRLESRLDSILHAITHLTYVVAPWIPPDNLSVTKGGKDNA